MPIYERQPEAPPEVDTATHTQPEELPHYKLHRGDASSNPPFGMFAEFIVEPGEAPVFTNVDKAIADEAITEGDKADLYAILGKLMKHGLDKDQRYNEKV